MTHKSSYFMFIGVTATHVMLLILFLSNSGAVVPPVQQQIMQGVLIVHNAPGRQPPRREAETAPQVQKLNSPTPSIPLEPARVPASQQAVTVPQAKAPAAPQPQTAVTNGPVREEQPTPQLRQEAPSAALPARPAQAAEQAARPTAAAREEPVLSPRVDAGHLSNPAPRYPASSRRLGEQGTVMLEVLILPDGSVGDLRVKQTSGHLRLDAAALNAVRQWRYQPARKGGKPIAYWYLQPVVFSLTN